MSIDHSQCKSPFPYTMDDLKATWNTGMALSAICYGVLLLLGFMCICALASTRSQERRRTRIGLTVYVLVTSIVATVAEAYDVAVTTSGVLDKECARSGLMPPNPYAGDI
ncbi:hypothetical protein NP233_g3576 [Leucocoprinus birnbaumii]|uniref:Uncharacterized protein n=1 Tax=Leucocoprinus birnbaumii TaxID=56174 RepID=A0AAD5W016_9AGAR|nr:hypothetical protein NP233_g3576 [Leucocoprinus birnbaumii]